MKRSILVLFLVASFLSCSSLGTVSRGYDYSKQQIWEAINTIIAKKHGGVKSITQKPTTAISNMSVLDKKFGMDKSSYEVHASLTGFERPYFVDIEVRVYANSDDTTSYTKDINKAQEIQDEIKDYLYHRKYNSTLQEDYKPF